MGYFHKSLPPLLVSYHLQISTAVRKLPAPEKIGFMPARAGTLQKTAYIDVSVLNGGHVVNIILFTR